MSGIGGSEFLLLCLIGLLILGPERLPRVARQIGGWVGKARQMTRALHRQLQDEIDVEKNIGINPKDFNPETLLKPREDDTFSPLHKDSADDEAANTPVTPDDKAPAAAADHDPEKKPA